VLLLAGSLWLLAAPGFASQAAQAAPYVLPVTTTEDHSLAEHSEYCGGEEKPYGEECPLRAALESARDYLSVGSLTSIVVSVPEGHYLLTQGGLPLGSVNGACAGKAKCPITLQGAGAGRTIIDGQGVAGVILAVVEGSAPLTVAGVTLTHGGSLGAIDDIGVGLTVRESAVTESHATSDGGAINVNGAPQLTVIDSSITGNSAPSGGGIYAKRTPVTVVRSTLSGNHALAGTGGAIMVEEAGGEEATLIDSTVAGNAANTSGGGISLANPSASATLRYSTVAGNSAGTGGGGIYGGASLAMEGSILSGNSPDQCEGVPGIGVGANIIFGTSGCVFSGTGPIAADPKLGPLSANGGPDATMPLLRGSAALNGGGAVCPEAAFGGGPVDARGTPRPQGAGCDLGAFESAADAALSLTATPDPVTVGSPLSLTANVVDVGSEGLTGVKVTVNLPSGTIFLSAPAGCIATFAATTSVTCEVGSLSPGQVRPVSIGVRPEHSGALIETASVSVDQADYNQANDTATIASVVQLTQLKEGQGPQGKTTGPATSTLSGRTFTLDGHGNLTMTVSCSANATAGCRDVLALYGNAGSMPAVAASVRRPAKAALLAHVHVTIQAGRTASVRLHLDAAGMKLARAHRSFPARLLLSFAGATGVVSSHTYRLILQRAVAKRHG